MEIIIGRIVVFPFENQCSTFIVLLANHTDPINIDDRYEQEFVIFQKSQSLILLVIVSVQKL